MLSKVPMFSVFTVDGTTLPSLRDAATGAISGAMWDVALNNPENKKFIAAFEELAHLGTKAGVEGMLFHIHTPLLAMSKAQIIRKGIELGVDFTLTHSCYDPTPDLLACGTCDSCRIRLEGFREVGRKDPISYAKK